MSAGRQSVELTEEQVEDFRAAFSKFDNNGDGTIDSSELGTVLATLGMQVEGDQLQELIKELDEDASGTIEFGEFLNMIKRKLADAGGDSDIRNMHMVINKAQDGQISAAELRTFIREAIGETISDAEVDAMIRAADQSGNGCVSFEELKAMLQS